MKRYHRRQMCSHSSPHRSPTMVTFHDTRFVECRWWNDGWTVKTVVSLHDTGPRDLEFNSKFWGQLLTCWAMVLNMNLSTMFFARERARISLSASSTSCAPSKATQSNTMECYEIKQKRCCQAWICKNIYSSIQKNKSEGVMECCFSIL